MKKSRRSLAFISCLLFTPALSLAADLSGSITVRGKPLGGALITANLIGEKGPAAVSITKTGPQGVYILKGLRSGNYILLVDLDGRRIYQGRVALTGATAVKSIALN